MIGWTLLEAGLPYESVGNVAEIIGSEELKKIHPLGKLPAAVIDGRPLFESAAIATAIADLVPERRQAYLERLMQREHCTLTRH